MSEYTDCECDLCRKIRGDAPSGAIADAPAPEDLLREGDSSASHHDASNRPYTADIIRRLCARIRELEAAQAWQPIETAPKDGTRVWLWLADEGFSATAKWRRFEDGDEDWWLLEHDCTATIHDITHWRPLPKDAPKEGE